MSYSEKQFEEDVEVTKRILKDTYISNIVYVQERMKAGADESELKNIDELIIANERMIVYFDQNDDWVKKLHEDAKAGEDNGTSSERNDTGDDEEAIARIEETRNS